LDGVEALGGGVEGTAAAGATEAEAARGAALASARRPGSTTIEDAGAGPGAGGEETADDAAALGTAPAADDGVDGDAAAPARPGTSTSGSPRQSFHVSTRTGGRCGCPVHR